jgi:hypothetical protein
VLMRSAPARDAVRKHALRFDWTTISRAQYDLFARVGGGRATDFADRGTPERVAT